MPNANLLAYSEVDRTLQRISFAWFPILPIFVPVILPTLLFVVVAVELRRTQGKLNFFKFYRETELPPETSQEHQGSQSAARVPAPVRPRPPPRCACSCHQGSNGYTSERASATPPRSSRSSGRVNFVPAKGPANSSPLSDSEGHETASEQAVPANNMQGTGGTTHSGEALGRHDDPASPQTTAPGAAACPAMTNGQRLRSGSSASTSGSSGSEDEEAEKVRRRNVKMREEGVRVKVNYSQLATPAKIPAQDSNSVAATAGSSSPSGPLTPSSSGSPISTSAFASPAALQAPTQTPISGSAATPTATPPPGPQQQVSSMLPTSGDAAGPALVKIQEKLLAVPADAVSRRLLFDGRAILQRKVRKPRSAGFVNGDGESSQQSPVSAEGGQQSSGYPSEMME